MLYYSGFMDTVINASLLNLQEFEKYENDTTLKNVEDLGVLAAKVGSCKYRHLPISLNFPSKLTTLQNTLNYKIHYTIKHTTLQNTLHYKTHYTTIFRHVLKILLHQ